MDKYVCVIQAGELEPDGQHFIKNDLYCVEVMKDDVTKEEVDEWLESPECMKRVRELEQIGEEKFGKDYLQKYGVYCFYTSAVNWRVHRPPLF